MRMGLCCQLCSVGWKVKKSASSTDAGCFLKLLLMQPLPAQFAVVAINFQWLQPAQEVLSSRS